MNERPTYTLAEAFRSIGKALGFPEPTKKQRAMRRLRSVVRETVAGILVACKVIAVCSLTAILFTVAEVVARHGF